VYLFENIKGGITMNLFIFLLIAGAVGGILLFILRYETKKYEKNRADIENRLAQAGFNTSRSVGRNVGLLDTAHYSLYVDDTNKKWVITLASPSDCFMDKIRGFDELVDFIFFDEDADNWATKLHETTGKFLDTFGGGAKGGLSVMGVLLGAGLGGALGAATGRRVGLGVAVGGILGGVGMSRLGEMQKSQPPKSLSCAYGLIIQTTDGNESNPVSVYNFLDIPGKTMKGTPMVERSRRCYKKDIKIIAQLADMLGQIQQAAV
jgi:hypothetical protein